MAMHTQPMIEEGLMRWYKDRLRADDSLTVETDLLDAGYLDSLLIMDLVASVEKQYEISIDIEAISPHNFRSVRSLAALVAQCSL
jgi:acyl carrier protein